MRTPQPQIFSSSMKPGSHRLPERLVGKQALELEFLKGALKSAPRPKGADYVRRCRPRSLQHRRRMPA